MLILKFMRRTILPSKFMTIGLLLVRLVLKTRTAGDSQSALSVSFVCHVFILSVSLNQDFIRNIFYMRFTLERQLVGQTFSLVKKLTANRLNSAVTSESALQAFLTDGMAVNWTS